MNGFRRDGRRAMTLIEILIGAAIMAVAAFGLYELFFSGAKTAAVGMWRSASNMELRNGLRLLREDLGRASYPSVVHDGGTDIDHATRASVRSGRTDVGTGAGGILLEFFMCKPQLAVAGITKPGERIRCTLVAESGVVRYRREGGPTPIDRVLIRDVEYVTIAVEPAADNPDANLVTIEIGTVHPKFSTTKVADRTDAKVEVAVGGGV